MLQVEMKLLDARLEGLMGYATALAAGLDLRACAVQRIGSASRQALDKDTPQYTLFPGEKILVGTGIVVHLASLSYGGSDTPEMVLADGGDDTVAAMLLPRSGLGTKLSLRLANTVGLVDADYQGEIMLALENGGANEFVITALDRLAQMVVVPVLRPTYKVVQEFGATSERGTGGFGSTGIQ
jgi:dUTP pyrophosphatase